MTTETTTTTPIYRTWVGRLETPGAVLSKGVIQQFCHAIAASYYGYIMGGANTNLTPDDCGTLFEMFEEGCYAGGYRITQEHEDQGYAWLKGHGEKSVKMPPEVIPGFIEFRWIGVRLFSSSGYYRAQIIPVWRVVYHDADGEARRFDYSWSPWQG